MIIKCEDTHPIIALKQTEAMFVNKCQTQLFRSTMILVEENFVDIHYRYKIKTYILHYDVLN